MSDATSNHVSSYWLIDIGRLRGQTIRAATFGPITAWRRAEVLRRLQPAPADHHQMLFEDGRPNSLI